jgi:hypothetical protein
MTIDPAIEGIRLPALHRSWAGPLTPPLEAGMDILQVFDKRRFPTEIG